jgi:F0F1-type ATP synthase assembly protein I
MCRWYEDASWPRRDLAQRIGLLMILLGLIWFGVRMGWFDFTLFHMVPFGPLIVTIIGIWMVYRGFMTKGMVCSKNHKEV